MSGIYGSSKEDKYWENKLINHIDEDSQDRFDELTVNFKGKEDALDELWDMITEYCDNNNILFNEVD